MTNPLIAAKEDTTDWSTGISLVSSVTDLSDAISGGSWIEVGLGVAGLAAEAVSLVVDPLGTLAGYGVGWLIEHCQPLQDALDWIAGDPAQIEAYAKTWDNVATRISEVATAQNKAVAIDVTDWTGQTATAYKSAASNTTNLLTAANTAATAAASAIRMAGGVVAAVRETVRDLVAQTVGRLAVWAAEALFTCGLATPVVAVQATAYIAKTVAMIAKLFSKLAKTMAKLKPLLKQLKSAFGDIAKAFKKTPSKSGKDADTTTPANTKKPDSNDADTNPASTKPDTDAPASTPDNTKTPRDPSDTNSTAPASARNGDPANTQDKVGTCGGREPVDMSTGEYYVPIVDLELPGVLPIELWRRHRSNYRSGRWLGPSWSSFLDLRVIATPEGLTFVGEDGMLLAYPDPEANATVLPLFGEHSWPLAATTDGYQIHDPVREITWYFTALDAESQALGDFPIAGIVDRHSNWIRYHYDANRHPTHLSSSSGYQVSFTTSHDRVTSIRVDGTSATTGVALSTLICEFDYTDGDLTTVTNSFGGLTRYTYDRAHRMRTWHDPDGTHFTNTYDDHGRIVRQVGTDSILNSTFSYETLPNRHTRTHVTNSLGVQWYYEFDSGKRLVVQTDGAGALTRTDYAEPVSRHPFRIIGPDLTTTYYYRDDNDHIVRVHRPDGSSVHLTYHARNRPATVTDPDGAVLRYGYDDAGNLTSITDPDGISRRFTYHPNGSPATIIESDGSTTTFETDAAGQPIRIVDASGQITSITRDHVGLISTITDANGDTTSYTWTPNGRPLSRVDPDGLQQSWTYSSNGDLLSHTDRADQVQRYSYGPFAMLASHTRVDGSTTNYTWDSEQQLLTVTNPLAQVWSYEYDPAGRVSAETDYNGAQISYLYEPTGQVATVTPASGIPRHHSYDRLGRLTEIRAESGEALTYVYTSAGHLNTATTRNLEGGGHVLRYQRSTAGRLLAAQLDDRPPTQFGYDHHGRAVTRVTPTGKTTQWGYGPGNRVNAIVADTHHIGLNHDALGRVNGWQAGAVSHSRVFDSVGHVTNSTLTATQPLRRDEYSWRADGYITTHTTTTAGHRTRTRSYELDPIGRITALTTNAATQRFTYDALSNITDATPTDNDPADQTASPQPLTDPSREYHRNLLIRRGRTRYHYDSDGRLTRKHTTRISRKPAITHYRYNAFDQLTDVFTPDGQWWRYTYDAFGRRTTKQLLSRDHTVLEIHEFTWNKTDLIEQTTPTETTSWDYLPDSSTPVAQSVRTITDHAFHVIATDIAGTPTDLVNPTTTTTSTAETGLWGKTIWRGDTTTVLRFPGQQYDPETGLHYNHHRYYDPHTARYLTQDPLGLTPAPNPNTYPHNPITWLDPLGLQCLGEDEQYLYRAVLQAELEQILDTRRFSNPEGIESKYFALTEEGASAYARGMFAAFPEEGPYTIVRTIVNRNDIPEISRIDNLADAGVGDAIALPTSVLSQLGRPRILPYGLTGG
ncbi:RHS repeat-associated core domain-containing protein [Nocardia caishijiensis]|uniref:RHS repeat-associated protein n=1 Tax=Nocardia caishijiensis TaxID=184756 RepID=A0ABQ6YHA7_9NOCA|nr:RHS repeat-associated core domain-containing protein [Nocardia caishijiensis]KAF0845145.1 RHS repeat-associated protein [Nocardia caishijiensis]